MPGMKVTIPNGGTSTSAFKIGVSGYLAGLKVPAMTSITTITVQVAEKESGTFVDLFLADGTAVTATCSTSAARGVSFDPGTVAGFEWYKLTVGSAQTGDKDIIVMFRTERD